MLFTYCGLSLSSLVVLKVTAGKVHFIGNKFPPQSMQQHMCCYWQQRALWHSPPWELLKVINNCLKWRGRCSSQANSSLKHHFICVIKWVAFHLLAPYTLTLLQHIHANNLHQQSTTSNTKARNVHMAREKWSRGIQQTLNICFQYLQLRSKLFILFFNQVFYVIFHECLQDILPFLVHKNLCLPLIPC